MQDNDLRISFDYKKPDTAVLITYKIWGGSYLVVGGEPSISVIKTYTGEKAIELYSELSGKTIEEIEKEADNA